MAIFSPKTPQQRHKGLGSFNLAIWPEIFDIMKTLKSSFKLIYNPVLDVNFMFW